MQILGQLTDFKIFEEGIWKKASFLSLLKQPQYTVIEIGEIKVENFVMKKSKKIDLVIFDSKKS